MPSACAPQAYVCLTDVLVRDVLSICVRHSSRATTQDLLCKDTGSVDDAVCHIEVIEYCDLGNLSSAIKQQVGPCLCAGAGLV
jgi:hypothetical protein